MPAAYKKMAVGHDTFLPCRSHGKKYYQSVFMSAFSRAKRVAKNSYRP